MRPKVTYLSAADGRPLCCHHWYPPGVVRASVILLHGIESHSQWFEGTCQWLSRLGFHVVAMDRRGSGADGSDGSVLRGDIDFFRTWINDVALLGKTLLALHPPRKVHLMGISWGGKLAAASAMDAGASFASLILVSPGLVPLVDVSFLTKMGVAWSYLFCPTRMFKIPIGPAAMFTASERWRDFIERDPLRLRKVTARFLVENRNLDGYLRRYCARIQIPAMMLLSETDEIIDKEKTKKLFSRFSAAQKKVLEYPGSTHTLEFEDNPDLWRKDVLAWLDGF